MALGDGIRRNVATVSPAERARLRAAIVALHSRFFPGSRSDAPPGHVSYWFKQDEIHRATHVHGGPEFLPWHRELVNRFEAMLREVDPALSLHYWDWTTDPTPLFTPDFMGSKTGDAGEPWLSAGFYVPGAVPFRSDNPFDPPHLSNPADPPRTLTRAVRAGAPPTGTPSWPSDADILAAPSYLAMRQLLERAHDAAHGYVGGTIGDSHTAFRDPFVFLVHSNVDRLYATWQAAQAARLDPVTVYGAEGRALTGEIEPWNGTGSATWGPVRPWAPPENRTVRKRYDDITVVAPPCYDTMPTVVAVVQVENPGNVVHFNDVPVGETTVRAAVFEVFGCGDVELRVTAGPSAPFSVFTPGGRVTSPHGATASRMARIWFAYTAGPAGSVANGSVTIHCPATGQNYAFTLRANAVARERVATVLVLDRSGSMDEPAGTGARRVEALREAAGRFAELVPAGNGVGVVRFDSDAQPALAVTDVGPGAFDPGRGQVLAAIGAHATNLLGRTSIGDGVVLGRSTVAAAPAAYTRRAMVVFTDGLENEPATLASVMASAIDARTFAIGLGSESQVSTAALRQLANGTGGYLLLTGHLTPGTDDYFRLSKYFLQVLAGVTNTQVVLDPTGVLVPGAGVVRLPFVLCEADIDATVVLMRDLPVVRMRLETPAGELLEEGDVAALGEVSHGDGLDYYRFTLPAPVGAGAHAGTWHALLELDRKLLRKQDRRRAAAETAPARGVVRYSLVVQSYSNLRLAAGVHQTSMEPGATLTVRALLTEYGVPVAGRARVAAELRRPDGTTATVPLAEVEPGVFEAGVWAPVRGVYAFRVLARGTSWHGTPFTREALATAAVLAGGDGPFPYGGTPRDPDRERLCELLSCLLDSDSVRRALARQDVDADELARCLEHWCHPPREPEVERAATHEQQEAAGRPRPRATRRAKG